jgi:hypothetical protein
MTKNLKKFTIEKIYNYFFGSKIAIYLSLGLRKGGPRYRRSLQPSKENMALHNMKFSKFFCFSGSHLPSWIRIRIPD